MTRDSWQRQAREQLRLQREHERYLNQQRREAERARRQAEREQREEHVAQMQQEAERRTEETHERVEDLGGVLRHSLNRDGLDFDQLRLPTRRAPFRPGAIGRAETAPQWERFAPSPPGVLGRLFGGERRHQKSEQRAREPVEKTISTWLVEDACYRRVWTRTGHSSQPARSSVSRWGSQAWAVEPP